MPMSEENKQKARERMIALRAKANEPTATAASTAAGVNIPPDKSTIHRATVIPQKTQEELETELDTLTLEEWLAKHHNAMDANYDLLAKVAHLDGAQEVRDRLKDLGYEFPTGA